MFDSMVRSIVDGGIETFKRATGMSAWENGVVSEPRNVLGRIGSASAEILFPATSAFVRESGRVRCNKVYGPGEGEAFLDGILMAALFDCSTLATTTLLVTSGEPRVGLAGKLFLNSLLTHLPKSLNGLDRLRKR